MNSWFPVVNISNDVLCEGQQWSKCIVAEGLLGGGWATWGAFWGQQWRLDCFLQTVYWDSLLEHFFFHAHIWQQVQQAHWTLAAGHWTGERVDPPTFFIITHWPGTKECPPLGGSCHDYLTCFWAPCTAWLRLVQYCKRESDIKWMSAVLRSMIPGSDIGLPVMTLCVQLSCCQFALQSTAGRASGHGTPF